MSLTEPGTAIDEKGVVMSSWLLGYGHGRRPGKTVGLADDEAVEAIAGDQAGGEGLLLAWRFEDRLVIERQISGLGLADAIDGFIIDSINRSIHS